MKITFRLPEDQLKLHICLGSTKPTTVSLKITVELLFIYICGVEQNGACGCGS